MNSPSPLDRSPSRTRPLGYLAAVVGTALALSACSGAADAGSAAADSPDAAESPETFDLVIGSALPETAVPGATEGIMNHFTTEVERRVADETPHTLKFQRVWGGSVAGAGEEPDAIESGLLDFGTIVGSYHPEELQYLNLSFCAPFASTDPELVAEAFNRTWDANPELADHLRANHGVMRVGHALAGTGQYGVVSTFPAESMDALEGKRLLGVGSAITWLEGTGATPQPAPLADWYTLLQTGAAEGVLSFLDGVNNLSLHEVTDYLAPIAIGTSTNVIIGANEATWEDLPASVREIMTEVADEATGVGAEATNDAVDKALSLAEEQGLTVIEVDPEFQADWAEATATVPDRCVSNLDALGLDGAKILGDFIDAQVDLGHEFPVSYELKSN